MYAPTIAALVAIYVGGMLILGHVLGFNRLEEDDDDTTRPR